MKSADKLLAALAYEGANRDGQHGRTGIIGSIVAQLQDPFE